MKKLILLCLFFSSFAYATQDRSEEIPKELRKDPVYAFCNSDGLYYKAFKIDAKDGKVLIIWSNDKKREWLPSKLVRPFKNHGLDSKQIARTKGS